MNSYIDVSILLKNKLKCNERWAGCVLLKVNINTISDRFLKKSLQTRFGCRFQQSKRKNSKEKSKCTSWEVWLDWTGWYSLDWSSAAFLIQCMITSLSFAERSISTWWGAPLLIQYATNELNLGSLQVELRFVSSVITVTNERTTKTDLKLRENILWFEPPKDLAMSL